MGKIHLITVADLDDVNIGISCDVDLRAVQEFVREAAAHAGMAIDITEVSGEAFAAENITAAVRGLTPERDDTVIFYYSGHGARGESKPDAWPVVSLASPAPPYDSFDLGWIYQTLNKKSSRMLLMFVDCCQQLLPDDMLNECSPGAIRGLIDVHSATNYRLLFHMFEGEVLLMSCKPGQLSGCTPQRGGFFTATFLEALRTSARFPRAATWESIARLGSVPPRDRQEPIWKVVRSAQLNVMQAPGMEPFPGSWILGQEDEEEDDISALAFRALHGEKRPCGSCGAQLESGDRFCPECGTPSRVASDATGAFSPAMPSGKSPDPRSPVSQTGSMLRKAEQNPAPASAEKKLDEILQRVEDWSTPDISLHKLDEVLQRSEDVLARARKKSESQLEKLKDRLKDL